MRCNTRLVRTYAVAVFASAILAVPLTGTTEARAKTPAVLAAVDIDNFGRVNDHYYRGAQPLGPDYSRLATLGIRTVIDLQADGLADEPTQVKTAGMKFFRIPMTTRVAPTVEQLALFLKLVNDPANQPVYVHCAGGRHRTGVMTAIYRMTADGWTPNQAFKEMKQYKFGADFLHPEFKRFVYGYRPPPAPAPAETLAAASAG